MTSDKLHGLLNLNFLIRKSGEYSSLFMELMQELNTLDVLRVHQMLVPKTASWISQSCCKD